MHRSSSSHAASSSPAPGQASASSAAAAAASPQTASAPADIADLPAKLELLEAAGIARAAALQRYTPFLCSPAHHIAVRLAFLQSRGKLRQPPRLYQVICPSDTELCELHGEQLEELAGFKRRHLASQAWHQFCERHGVQQAQPEAQQPASGA